MIPEKPVAAVHDLHRLDDWRARLAAEMDRQRRQPFAWGKHDCATGFAAAVVEALTGVDLAADYRGQYSSPKGALRLLRDSGMASLGDFAALHLPEVHPSRADVGDLGVIPADGPVGEAFCMVDASGLIVLTPEGHGRLPRSDVKRTFKVG